MSTTRTETVDVADGSFDARLTLPERGHGPGIVLIHEIFGVNAYITAVAERLADLGYVVACPDLYWRIEPGAVLPQDEAGMGRAMDLVMQLDVNESADDCHATLGHLSRLPEVTGGVAQMGFCLGGSLAFLAAALAGSEDESVAPDCVVSYYGSLVPDAIEDLEDIACPVLFHFGGADPFIPRRKVALVEEAAASRPDVEVHVQDSGGHAFDNHLAPQFHHAPSAKAAWDVTVAFLGRHLPVDGD